MHIVIIGNGIAGITAARTLRMHSDHDITVISGETDYFFSRTALMYVYMGHMRFRDIVPYENWFWKKNRIGLKKAWVHKIDTERKTLLLGRNETMQFDKLLIATGAKSNRFGWHGQHLKGVQGLYSYQDLLQLEENTKNGINRAVIVGGGLIGIELAEMLHSRHFPVTLLVRENSYWNNILPDQESAMITRHIREHGFDLRLNESLKKIIADENERVQAVITESGEEIPCQLVGLTAGVSPNIGILKETNIHIDRGVMINHHMETNIPDIYAAGDCAQFHHALPDRRQIEQVWYTGKLQGETAAFNILGKRTAYDPGYWFNSAKFLDIEYQTYGTVNPSLHVEEEEFYWEHADGKKCLHFMYRKDNHRLRGVNAFGIRLRHQQLNQWLKEHRTIAYVLENFKAANFDPEFFDACEEEIIPAWNISHPDKKITLKTKNSLMKMIFG